jgi:hypothetical protein
MRKMIWFVATACFLTMTGTSFSQSCHVGTLKGSYAGTVTGHNTSGVPVAYQAIAHFDAAGHFSLSGFTYVMNGTVLVNNASAAGGTYTVNADCSGSIQITSGGQTFQFAILITGRDQSQFQMLETDGTATTTGNALRQQSERGKQDR